MSKQLVDVQALLELEPPFGGENGQQYAQRAKGALNLLPLSRHASSQTPTDPKPLSSQCHPTTRWFTPPKNNNQTRFLKLCETSYRIIDALRWPFSILVGLTLPVRLSSRVYLLHVNLEIQKKNKNSLMFNAMDSHNDSELEVVWTFSYNSLFKVSATLNWIFHNVHRDSDVRFLVINHL